MQIPSSHQHALHGKVSLPALSILGTKPSPQLASPADAIPNAIDRPKPAVIMLGLDDQGRPHASWFAEDQGDAAAVAADLMDFALIDVTTDDLAAIAAKLPKGKLFDSGKAFVPFVKRTVYDQLAVHLDEDYVTAAAGRVEAAQAAASEGYGKASKGEVALRLPEDWSKLVIGDRVLATDDPDEGWFDAEVLEAVGNDRFRLRWRDYPELPDFTRPIAEIALLHPKYPGR